MQVPSVPVSAHDVHAPEQAVSQQTPCAQNDDWHSLAFEHEAPRIFFPHELPLQTLGDTQLLSFAQALKQVLPLQMYGAQGSESGGAHWPVALQAAGGV